jgi:hypothetical protein
MPKALTPKEEYNVFSFDLRRSVIPMHDGFIVSTNMDATMARTYAAVSNKGGAGKTTLVTLLHASDVPSRRHCKNPSRSESV